MSRRRRATAADAPAGAVTRIARTPVECPARRAPAAGRAAVEGADATPTTRGVAETRGVAGAAAAEASPAVAAKRSARTGSLACHSRVREGVRGIPHAFGDGAARREWAPRNWPDHREQLRGF